LRGPEIGNRILKIKLDPSRMIKKSLVHLWLKKCLDKF